MRFPIFISGSDKMPKYGTFRYGKIAKYGRYNLVAGSSKAIGPYVRYRMRNRSSDGSVTPFITMAQERIDVPATETIDRWRIRTNNSEWVYIQQTEVGVETFKVRIRSTDTSGGNTPWVYGERGTLQSQ